MTPRRGAALFAPMGLGGAVGTMVAPALARRMKQAAGIAGGLVGAALGSLRLGLRRRCERPAAGDDRYRRTGAGHWPTVRAGHRAGHWVRTAGARRLGASMSDTGNYFGGSLGSA